MTNNRVLVTGADGFIGSHVVERLVAAGRDVRALCMYNSFSSRGWLDSSEVRGEIEIVLGDVRDPDSMADAAAGCSEVVHLAALIAIPYSYQAPKSYVDTNVMGTVNVLRAAERADVRRVVHVSTSEVYGTPHEVPISESHPLRAQSPYAASKIGADMMADAWARSFGLDVLTVRPFNTFGPRQSLRAVIPTVLAQLIETGSVRLGDLRPRRDFTYVTDTADALVRALDVDHTPPSTVQLGTGRSVSIAELVTICCDVVGVRADPSVEEARLRPAASEVMVLESDPRQAAKVLGWHPSVSLEEGLARTAQFLRDQGPIGNAATYHV